MWEDLTNAKTYLRRAKRELEKLRYPAPSKEINKAALDIVNKAWREIEDLIRDLERIKAF